MHPIERLRYVARASGVSPALAVQESASALSAFADEPGALLVACRRMLMRQPVGAPLWWMAARVVAAADPRAEAHRVVEELHRDQTPTVLARALEPDCTVCVLGWPESIGEALVRRGDVWPLVVDVHREGRGLTARLAQADSLAEDVAVEGLGAAAATADVVLLEAIGCGGDEFVAVAGSYAAAAVARHAGRPVWVVCGVGTVLPDRLWDELVRTAGLAERSVDRDEELVPLDLVDRIVGPGGIGEVYDMAARRDCPVPPELLADPGAAHGPLG